MTPNSIPLTSMTFIVALLGAGCSASIGPGDACELGDCAADGSCRPGYHADDRGDCVADLGCEPTTCSGNGVCEDSSGSPMCTCDVGWTGTACDTCAAGRRDDGRGDCTIEQTCRADTCSGHGACDDSAGVTVCACDEGYTGQSCQTAVGEWPNDHSQLGMNLNFFWGGRDNAPVDIFRFSTPFFFPIDQYASHGAACADVNPDGYPLDVTSTWGARTMIEAHGYPAGEYHFFHEGEGSFDFGGDSRYLREVERGHHVVELTPRGRDAVIDLTITETTRADPLRNMHLIMPGHEDTWRDEPWNPDFIRVVQSFKVLRFMNWMSTNYSVVRTWSDGNTMNGPGWGEWGHGGVPVEFMIDLCEEVHADGWFNIPHLADDDYVRQFATRLRDQMDPGLRIYIEYSNETWNWDYDQYHDLVQVAEAAGIQGSDSEKVWRYTAVRSVEIFGILEEVFGSAAMGTRVIRVLPTQVGPDMATYTMLNYDIRGQPPCTYGDAMAVAPYFKIPDTRMDPNMSMSQALVELSGGIDNPWEGDWDTVGATFFVQETKRVIRDSACPDLELLLYEGGQHLTTHDGEPTVEAFFEAINRDPGIYGVYRHYLDALKAEGLTLLTMYTSVGPWSGVPGCFTHLERVDQDWAEAPKFRALIDWIDDNPYDWSD